MTMAVTEGARQERHILSSLTSLEAYTIIVIVD